MEGEAGRLADPVQELPEPVGAHRCQALGGEDEGRGRVLRALQATQGAQLAAKQGMDHCGSRAWNSPLLERCNIVEGLIGTKRSAVRSTH